MTAQNADKMNFETVDDRFKFTAEFQNPMSTMKNIRAMMLSSNKRVSENHKEIIFTGESND